MKERFKKVVRASIEDKIREQEEAEMNHNCKVAFKMLRGTYSLKGTGVDLKVKSGAEIYRFVRDSFHTQKHSLAFNLINSDDIHKYYVVIAYVGKSNSRKPTAFIDDFQALVPNPLVDFSVGGEANILKGSNAGIPCLLVFRR